mgnify:CR=1 FL=1|jgi:ankyrin repeat protein
MGEFSKGNAFARHTAQELLLILLDHGFTFNYHREADGLTPIQYVIRNKNYQLLKLLMKVKHIDVNMKAQYSQSDPVNSKYYANLPTLHMLVLANDYDMMKVFLFAGELN